MQYKTDTTHYQQFNINLKYKMKHTILIILNLAMIFSAYSQQKTIQGYVYDEVTLQTLPYASIMFKELDQEGKS